MPSLGFASLRAWLRHACEPGRAAMTAPEYTSPGPRRTPCDPGPVAGGGVARGGLG
jgi:hypothetical protein